MMFDSDSSKVAPASNPVVQDYLDFMLRSVTQDVQEDLMEEAAEEVVFSAPPAEPVTDTLEIEADDLPPVSRSANGRPDWAQSEFSGLLFQVDGLRLVAPLTELGGIAELGELTPIFAQPAWFMGLLRWNGRNIRVVDTARLIMPERVENLEASSYRQRYQCVLMLDGTDWGLAIDGEAESLKLDPANVRWRGSLKARPWLAGTVADRLCALLDVRALAHRLYAEQHARQP